MRGGTADWWQCGALHRFLNPLSTAHPLSTCQQRNTSGREKNEVECTRKGEIGKAVRKARGCGAPEEAVGIGSSTAKDCRLHPLDWTDDLDMGWECRRRKRLNQKKKKKRKEVKFQPSGQAVFRPAPRESLMVSDSGQR